MGETPQRRRRARRIGCAALVLLISIGVWIVLRDDPPPDDADLLPEPIAEVPLGESVYGALVDALAALPEPREWAWEEYRRAETAGESPPREPWGPCPLDRAVWSAPDRLAVMGEYYAGVSAGIDRIAAALERERGGWPGQSAETAGSDSPWSAAATRHFLSRALYRRARGDLAGASLDLETLNRIGESPLAEGARSWLRGMIACTTSEIAWTGWESLLHDGDLAPEVEERIIAVPPILDRDPGVVARCYRNEYSCTRENLQTYDPAEDRWVDGRTLLLRLFLKRNRTLAAYAEAIRHDLAQIDLPPPRRTSAQAWNVDGAIRRAILHANSGDWIIANGLGNGEIIIRSFDRLRIVTRAVRTLVALRAFERARGALPTDLAALVAAFPALGNIPIDPYSGAPFGYDPARRILWSVGEDGVDGNGDGWEALRDDPEASRYALPDWIWPIPPLPGGR